MFATTVALHNELKNINPSAVYSSVLHGLHEYDHWRKYSASRKYMNI